MTSTTCANHPGSPAVALCVGCGDVLCAACSTRIQGRNLCARCVAGELARPPEASQSSLLPRLVAYGGAAGGAVLLIAVLAGLGLALHTLG
ncbi:MAG: hypothetical protein KDA24_27120 [Deltaproteobacteria bacterium]|nr:hypothetical protein [Deltaproteobacteria bacterium]